MMPAVAHFVDRPVSGVAAMPEERRRKALGKRRIVGSRAIGRRSGRGLLPVIRLCCQRPPEAALIVATDPWLTIVLTPVALIGC